VNQNPRTAAPEEKSATTERNAGERRRARGARPVAEHVPTTSTPTSTTPIEDTSMNATTAPSLLNATSSAKFVLFGIPRAEQVADGPVMRGFLEVRTEENAEPAKVNVAAWLKIGRQSGTEYLSLKVGNNSAENPDVYTVGPFYGRLFRQIEERGEAKRTRYFGFIENAEKTGEDEDGRGTYRTHWQLRLSAKPAVSNDGKTHYISGQLAPAQTREEAQPTDLPF